MSDAPLSRTNTSQSVGDLSRQFDVAVVIPTILRNGLLRAVRSIYAQDFAGHIQILVGIDGPHEPNQNLDILLEECPADTALCILDPGYSTAKQHGGLYSSKSGGSLRTVLSYMAHSEFVAYLDDDNWLAPNHLSSLRQAIEGHDWAFSHRWFVDPATMRPVCIDEWESVGPGRGFYKEKVNGFADPNTIMINKLKCHEVLPKWSISPYENGTVSDRLVYDSLQARHTWRDTKKATSYYVYTVTDPAHPLRLEWFKQKGIEMPADPPG